MVKRQQALYYLRRSNEVDPQEMQAPEELRALARNGLSKIAARELKARGPRQDGGLLSDWAMRLLSGKPLEEVRVIAFEIGMLGQHGLDINDLQETHVLRALPGRTFSALELLAKLDRTLRSLEALAVQTGITNDTLYGYLKSFLWVGIVSRSKQGLSVLLQLHRLAGAERLRDLTSGISGPAPRAP